MLLGQIGYTKQDVDNLTPYETAMISAECIHMYNVKLRDYTVIIANGNRADKPTKGMDEPIKDYERKRDLRLGIEKDGLDYDKIKNESAEVLKQLTPKNLPKK